MSVMLHSLLSHQIQPGRGDWEYTNIGLSADLYIFTVIGAPLQTGNIQEYKHISA